MKVLAVAGSSGGHIFPALSFLDALREKEKSVDTLLILPQKIVRRDIIPDSFKIHYIPVSTIRLRLDSKNFSAIVGFFKGALEGIRLVLAFHPDVVIGFGSLVSLPVVLCAWFLRIRTIIHEQNVIPGRANKFLAKFVDTIAVSFEESKPFLGVSERRIVVTGNPLRRELKRYDKARSLSFFGLGTDRFTILVMGGSQGSRNINAGFLKAIKRIKTQQGVQVIHIAGSKDYDSLKEDYRAVTIENRLFAFLKEMHYAYSACDLVVSRAGATSITEILIFKIPAILIPYPFAYRHQMANARVLEKFQAATIIKDEELASDMLKEKLENLLNDSTQIQNMRSAYDKVYWPDARTLLVEQVLATH